MPAVVRSIEIQAPPSAVWRWLATPEALRRWLSPELEIDLRVGGAYRIPGGEGTISGTVLELVPEGALILSWLEEGANWVHPARLSVTLAPIASGTRVTMAHDGFAGIGRPGWPGTMEAYERGVDRHRLLERLSELVAAPATPSRQALASDRRQGWRGTVEAYERGVDRHRLLERLRDLVTAAGA